WKWARMENGPKTRWEPIARDRDHAFVSYEGVVGSTGRMVRPTVVSFTGTPDVAGLTATSDIDRRLLASLDRAAWDSIARDLQRRVTARVIPVAATQMRAEPGSPAPPLGARPKARRASPPAVADAYYAELAQRTLVHGTDAADRATIVRTADGSVDVRLES